MKRLLIIAVTAVATLATSAPADAQQWSLDSCISYALNHNIEVRQRILAARQGELAVREAKDAALPRVSGYGSESFSFGRGLTALNTYPTAILTPSLWERVCRYHCFRDFAWCAT